MLSAEAFRVSPSFLTSSVFDYFAEWEWLCFIFSGLVSFGWTCLQIPGKYIWCLENKFETKLILASLLLVVLVRKRWFIIEKEVRIDQSVDLKSLSYS